MITESEIDVIRSKIIKKYINAIIIRLKNHNYYVYDDIGSIQVDLPESRPNSNVRFVPKNKWNDDMDVKKYNLNSSGGFAHSDGRVVIKTNIEDNAKSVQSLIKLLSDTRSEDYSVLVHELAHELDHASLRIPKKHKQESFGSTGYFRQGWEQEARFQQLLVDFEQFVVSTTIVGFTWAGTRSTFWPPVEKLRRYMAYKSFSLVAWPHLTTSGKTRIITRLLDYYPVIVASCISKIKKDITKSRRELAKHLDIMEDLDKLEAAMKADKTIQTQLAKYKSIK